MIKMEPKHVLMIPPTYFEVSYNINPHMEKTLAERKKVRPKKAQSQWDGLGEKIVSQGYIQDRMDPVKGLPDIVFTANAAFVFDGRIIMGRFKNQQRQPETEYFYKWFSDNDYEIVKIKEDFEGGGDALLWQGKLIGGHGFRSTLRGIQTAAMYANFFGIKAVPLKLIDPRFYHVDTCFCPMGERALYYPGAIASDSCEELKKVGETVEVSEKDALKMVCNGIYLEGINGPKFIVNDISRKLRKIIESWGIEILINDTSEFQKSGGSNRCLTLFL